MEFSPLAWCGIIVIVIVTIVVNYGMVAILRNRSEIMKIKMPKNHSAADMNKTIEVLRDPFRDERRQMNELSGLVDQLREQDSKKRKPENDED